jgi:hypothetical protein
MSVGLIEDFALVQTELVRDGAMSKPVWVPRDFDAGVNLMANNRCPHCGRIWCQGELPQGTALYVICPRERCKKPFVHVA